MQIYAFTDCFSLICHGAAKYCSNVSTFKTRLTKIDSTNGCKWQCSAVCCNIDTCLHMRVIYQ